MVARRRSPWNLTSVIDALTILVSNRCFSFSKISVRFMAICDWSETADTQLTRTPEVNKTDAISQIIFATTMVYDKPSSVEIFCLSPTTDVKKRLSTFHSQNKKRVCNVFSSVFLLFSIIQHVGYEAVYVLQNNSCETNHSSTLHGPRYLYEFEDVVAF